VVKNSSATILQGYRVEGHPIVGGEGLSAQINQMGVAKSTALVQQDGIGHDAVINQSMGMNNNGTINQGGVMDVNNATLNQTGSGNNGTINQNFTVLTPIPAP